jgi:hypothetical protein
MMLNFLVMVNIIINVYFSYLYDFRLVINSSSCDLVPSQQEIENMHRQIFGDIEDEDGLDRVLARVINLRG